MRIFYYIWVSPNSFIGLFVGMIGLLSGGKCQVRRGCLEFYGGLVTWTLQRINQNGVLAMTLGHTIVGQTADSLRIARDHEQVHVRQYERWGPLFIPMYLVFSLILWFQANKDCYRDNPFEVEAYRIADPHHPNSDLDG